MTRKPEGKTILAIEDERDVLQFVSRVLTLEGYSVLSAENGEDGLGILASQGRGRIDMVLLDLKLPVRDGWSVLEEIRSQPGLRTLPVVVFSAFAGSDNQERARALGADGYLIKPLSASELVKSVDAFMTRKKD